MTKVSQSLKSKIFVVRDKQVLLDKDLAELYEVETRVLNQAVKRNADRFPEDFMFVLTDEEVDVLVSQSVIPLENVSWGFSAESIY